MLLWWIDGKATRFVSHDKLRSIYTAHFKGADLARLPPEAHDPGLSRCAVAADGDEQKRPKMKKTTAAAMKFSLSPHRTTRRLGMAIYPPRGD